MSEKHTQGRLLVTVGYGPYAGRMILAEGRVSCIAEAMNEDAEANARRLVACWNACEGVPTEVLEAQQSGGLPWSVADQIEQRLQFDAYKEGSEEAFGAVVEQKRKAEECVSRMESTIQSQQGVIVKMRPQRDELLAALEVARKLVHLGVGATNEELHQIDAAIAKVKGGAA